MLLLKTISIFLKNKCKELKIIEIFLTIIAVCSIFMTIVFILSLIGYFSYHNPTLYSILEVKRIIGAYSFYTMWSYALIGFMAIIFIIIAPIGGTICVMFLLYAIVIEFIPYIIRSTPGWCSDFKNFIVDNWKIAKIFSGQDVRYVLKNYNDGTVLLKRYGYNLVFEISFLFELRQIKHEWNYNNLLITDEERLKILEDEMFYDYLKHRKQKLSDFKWIKFSEYKKEL